MEEDFTADDFKDRPAPDRFAPTAEPSATVLGGARELFHLYVALVREGFDERQAMFLIAEAMKNSG